MLKKQVILSRRWALGLAVLILLLGSALRIVALEESPPGFSLDEASESYDAYSLWHTGRDQHGVLLPIALHSFGDYRMPLFVYTMAPVVGLGGLSVFTARLTAAFWSILALAAAYWAGAQMLGRPAGLATALFLAISPWHVPLSRIAYEPDAAPLVTALVVGTLWRWQRTSRARWLIAAAVISGLGFYSYAAMKLFLPLTAALLGLLFWRTVLARRRQVLVAAVIGAALAFPVFYGTLRHPEQMQARYRDVAVFRAGRPLGEAVAEALQNARHYFFPPLLSGRGQEVWGDFDEHLAGTERLYPVQAILILAGIGWGLTQRERRLPLAATGIWLLTGVLPSILTTRPNHEHRLLTAAIPWQLLSGLGMVGILSLLLKARLARLAVIGTILAWVGVNAVGYFGYYFTQYPTDVPPYVFDVGVPEAVQAMDELDDEHGAVYFNCYTNMFPYIDVLFFTRYDPHLLQADLPEWRNRNVRRVGKYYFVCDTEAMWASGLPGLFVVPADELPGVEPLVVTRYANGQLRFRIVGRSREESFLGDTEWLSQCAEPAPPLDAVLVAQAAGQDLRQPAFDCTSAWLYPAGVGAYVLHRDLTPQSEPFIARRLANARLILDMPTPSSEFPAFAVYMQEHAVALPAFSALPITTLVSPAVSLIPPVYLDGPLAFLGAVVHTTADGLDVETWWQVTEAPIIRPFSIMAHLVDENGEVLSVADGLGVSPLTLFEGDVIVQRHRFPRPTEEGAIWLQAGAYWLDTLERWPVADIPGADILSLPLEERH